MSQQPRYQKCIIFGRHQSQRAVEQFGEAAAFVDAEVIYDWLHREWERMCKLIFGGGHDLLKVLLRHGLYLRCKHKPHAPPRHATQHPETPETFPEFLADAFDEN